MRILNGIAISYNWRYLWTYAQFLFSQSSSADHPTFFVSEIVVLENVVISLSFRADRRAYIVRHFNSIGIPFKFFDALHGSKDSGQINASVQFSARSKEYLSSGSIGCIASHITVWKQLLNSTADAYLVFEDDVIILSKYDEILRMLGQVPADFDLVYLGSRSIQSWLNLKHVYGNIYEPFSIRKGAYAYLLSKTGALKLLEETKEIKITCGGIDTILGVATMRNKLVTYHLKPGIAGVNFSFTSNIRNFSDNSKTLHQTEF